MAPLPTPSEFVTHARALRERFETVSPGPSLPTLGDLRRGFESIVGLTPLEQVEDNAISELRYAEQRFSMGIVTPETVLPDASNAEISSWARSGKRTTGSPKITLAT